MSERTPVKRALLVGVTIYQNYQNNTLKGCVKDVGLVQRTLLDYYGFQKENIKKLLDQKATVEEVKGNLEQMAKDTEPNDVFCFYFSGKIGSKRTGSGTS